jgi:RNA polymerase sigma-70 factor (sigma-E family)
MVCVPCTRCPLTPKDRLMSEFDSFVRARSAALLRSAYLLTGDQHLAEDLVQSALARTHRAWSRLHDRGNAEAYTRRTMYHLQVSWWRRRRPESMPGRVPEPRRGWGDHADQTTIRMTLRAALLRLSVKQRAVLILRYFEDRTEAEAAELLGVTVGTVKSQNSKALAKLRVVAPELAELYHLEGVAR